MKFLLFIAALSLPTAAFAADQVTLASSLYVEHLMTDAGGKSKVVRDEPKLVVPGEKLLFELSYRNEGSAPADSFVVANPIPGSVEFVAAETPGADYSVDGGTSFAPLARLTVKAADGSARPATARDVNVVRWQFARPIAVGGGGKLIFRGVVR